MDDGFSKWHELYAGRVAWCSIGAAPLHAKERYASWRRIVAEIVPDATFESGFTMPLLKRRWGEISAKDRERLVASLVLLFPDAHT